MFSEAVGSGFAAPENQSSHKNWRAANLATRVYNGPYSQKCKCRKLSTLRRGHRSPIAVNRLFHMFETRHFRCPMSHLKRRSTEGQILKKKSIQVNASDCESYAEGSSGKDPGDARKKQDSDHKSGGVKRTARTTKKAG